MVDKLIAAIMVDKLRFVAHRVTEAPHTHSLHDVLCSVALGCAMVELHASPPEPLQATSQLTSSVEGVLALLSAESSAPSSSSEACPSLGERVGRHYGPGEQGLVQQRYLQEYHCEGSDSTCENQRSGVNLALSGCISMLWGPSCWC